jgi:hypothetical protein
MTLLTNASRLLTSKVSIKLLLRIQIHFILLVSSTNPPPQHNDERMIELLIDYGADIGQALCMVGLNRPSIFHKARHQDMLNAPTIG